jgi:long-chain acyl-CoA synthetase
VLLENEPTLLTCYWATQRSGLIFTPMSTHSKPDELSYLIQDCGASAVIVAPRFRDVVRELPSVFSHVTFFVTGDDQPEPGFTSWSMALAAEPSEPIADESAGYNMLYSSGTTGRPKGVQVEYVPAPVTTTVPILEALANLLGYSGDTVYLSVGPLYHSGPLGFAVTAMRRGATVVLSHRFDPVAFLGCVDRYRVTDTWMVPTMFVRLLKLPEKVRTAYDLSSLRTVVHAAAPCPVPVKQAMIEWFGERIFEFYAGSEGMGGTFIGPVDWLAHPGSVGRPTSVAEIHIVGPDGQDVATGQEGVVYFAGGRPFRYHNDDGKTASVTNAQGWTTLGDIGYQDAEGYLYLTSRVSDVVISGGVNVYPREVEDVLVLHPKVADVAVFGVPSEDLGEEVKAVVQLGPGHDPTASLADELVAWCKERLSSVKCPKSIDFAASLPRQENGKLYKNELKALYRGSKPAGVVPSIAEEKA